MNWKCFILTWFFLIATAITYAQQHPHDPGGVIRASLGPLIEAQLGPEYDFYYAVLDSLIGRGPTRPEYEDVTDPFGTLSGCVIFWASPALPEDFPDEFDPDDSTVIGVFRNGSILWQSGPVCRGSFGEFTAGIFCSGDLNNDGKVEVAMLSKEFDKGPSEYMWIFAWDGNSGAIINQIDPITRQSTLVSAKESFELIDPGGDDIWEIRGSWATDSKTRGYFPKDTTSTYPWITYSWNGSQYGLWPQTVQVPGIQSLPANRLQVSCSCVVSRSGDEFDFTYVWTNSPQSKQKVSSINLVDVGYTGAINGPAGWDSLSSALVNGKEWYVVSWRKNSMIKPGETKTGFGLRGEGLPSIVTYCVQGFRPAPLSENMEEITVQMMANDVQTNSVSGRTIAPRIPPASFDGFGFLDTTTSYIDQSRALGWITSDQARNKYLRFVDTAKAYLQANIRGVTKARLDSAILSVHPDSVAGLLTSEACALIRFNSEYVLQKLREEDR